MTKLELRAKRIMYFLLKGLDFESSSLNKKAQLVQRLFNTSSLWDDF